MLVMILAFFENVTFHLGSFNFLIHVLASNVTVNISWLPLFKGHLSPNQTLPPVSPESKQIHQRA